MMMMLMWGSVCVQGQGSAEGGCLLLMLVPLHIYEV